MSKKHYREPVKNTCPTIDKVIDAIDSAKRDLKRAISVSELERARSEAEDSYGHLDKLDQLMEKLRSDNELPREWGNDEANRVDELESEQEELRNENDELKREIERLNSQLDRQDY